MTCYNNICKTVFKSSKKKKKISKLFIYKKKFLSQQFIVKYDDKDCYVIPAIKPENIKTF